MKDSNAPCQKSADKLNIAFGEKTLEIETGFPVDVLGAFADYAPLSDYGIQEALDQCVYSESYSACAERAEKILFILPDITRKSGMERFFPSMLAEAEKHGKEVSIIFAVGTHRAVTEDEKKRILGGEIYSKYKDRLFDHDCENLEAHAFYGITKSKTPIFINKIYLEHDLIVPIGSVSHHYFAGYGGGRKLIFPGIAAKKSILRNHMLALDVSGGGRHPLAKAGELNHNPVHRDIVDALMISRSGRNFFSVNTVLDEQGRILDMVCGDLFMAHHKACEILDSRFRITLDKKYKSLIVSCGGFPKDINMVQAQKSLDRAASAAEEGADIFLFAECADGYGNSYFRDFFDLPSSKAMLESLLADYQINRQTAFNLRTLTERFNVRLYGSLSEEDCARMGFQKLNAPEDMLRLLKPETAFIPSAYSFLFG
ncbi:nickel-dependent lactate racemase [Geovibrio thiophilus]|uniref:Nickel-dependent lactate racemase n=1 Tax=Geovibrio thiophilus TaxID=139438 RepID=A0A3R5XW40_9BACT|nr:nickel-dependent lactate racemase [Geovibrio thiophilus]QAR32066.1 nickel-dependent lactate racemase [Geovibrio thiophilus]